MTQTKNFTHEGSERREGARDISDASPSEGGCLCGSVRYKFIGTPKSVSICHCQSCRLASGAPSVSWLVVSRSRFMLSGELSTFQSSAHVLRSFCIRCGTPVSYEHQDAPNEIELTTATLCKPERFPPWREIWVSEKLPWVTANPDLEHFQRESQQG